MKTLPSFHLPQRLLRESSGAALIELLITVVIMVSIASLLTTSFSQVSSVRKPWRDELAATKDLRHAGSWLARDAFNAQTTNLVDGNPAVGTVTLNWTDGGGLSHISQYVLTGGQLVRDIDGDQIVVARQVVSVGFSLSGSVITFNLEVAASDGTTKTTSLKTYLRALQL
jgi:type II secretory pathway pseudopilin PulG